MIRLVCALPFLVSVAPALASDAGEGVSALDALHASHAWARATTDDSGFVFVEIENQGDDPVTLYGGQTTYADSVELGGLTWQDGAALFEPIASISVAPGAELELVPQGLALRLTGLVSELVEGDTFDFDILFDQGEIRVKVEIEGAAAMRSNHAGYRR